jgi:hypothetical protein
MCFSKEVSLGTFIIGVIGSALVYSFNTKIDKILAIFFFYIILMQLLEFILWNNLTCNVINKITTFTAIILNATQPVVLAMLVLYNYKLPNQTSLIIYTILYSLMMLIYNLQTKTLCTLKNKFNHLEWKWNSLFMYIFAYIMYILYLSYIILSIPYKWNKMLILIILLSYLLSIYIYWGTNNIDSLWCFFAAFFPIIWFIFRKIKYIK